MMGRWGSCAFDSVWVAICCKFSDENMRKFPLAELNYRLLAKCLVLAVAVT